MAKLTNDEQNINLTIDFLKKIKDTIIINNESETFIPFVLKLVTPEKTYNTDKFVMSVRELKYLIENLNHVLHVSHQEDYTFDYYNSEALFEMIVSFLSEDLQIEIMIWINIGALTNGDKYGYDEGYRFIVDLDTFEKFVIQLEKEIK